jgi:hypothetical protein
VRDYKSEGDGVRCISRDESYDDFEKKARYYGPNGAIMHTWTEKSAFNAGWKAALEAVERAGTKGNYTP